MNRFQQSTIRLRTMARQIYDAALHAADPDPLVRRFLATDGRTVLVDGTPISLGAQGRVIILAAGKAVAPMAHAAAEQLGQLATDGLVVIRQPGRTPITFPNMVAGHPLPDGRSRIAAQRMLDLARSASQGDLVLALFSGGASALLSAPAAPLKQDDLRRTTELLISSGADIAQINCVRKHLSSIKGGLLARSAQPAALATLLLSDVVGDKPEVIASGPTVPDPSTFADALEVLDRCGVSGRVSQPVLNRLKAGVSGLVEDTPGPEHPCFRHAITRVAGSNTNALEGAAAEARRLGFQVMIHPEPVTGEARLAASRLVSTALSGAAESPESTLCFLSGGETTVTLPDCHGIGGRNMELALAAAPEMAKFPSAVLLSAGTDGSDGPTGVSGAVSDSFTMVRAAKAGLDQRKALDLHNSHHFFHALDDLVVTGPTETNVMDLQILLMVP